MLLESNRPLRYTRLIVDNSIEDIYEHKEGQQHTIKTILPHCCSTTGDRETQET